MVAVVPANIVSDCLVCRWRSACIVVFSVPGSTKLHNLISKLKKWIKILEARIKLLPKSFLIEEKCRFLSNFSQNTAEVEIPGEFLLPKVGRLCVLVELQCYAR